MTTPVSSIALLAESSSHIGAGHFIEIANFARAAGARGFSLELWANRDTPEKVLDYAPLPPQLIDDFSPANLGVLSRELRRRNFELALTNFRRITNPQVVTLKANGLKVACIDELGNSTLDCDLVISPSIVPRFHRYSSQNPKFRVFAGPQYLFLAPEYEKFHYADRLHHEEVRTVTVSMGGVDRTGATIRIVESLRDWQSNVTKNIVLGPGFVHNDELESALAAANDKGFVVHRRLPSLAELFAHSDVVFTAGGNTLYELACLGTPAIVLFEDPHEQEQGDVFQKHGFGICLGSGREVTSAQIHSALEQLSSRAGRQAMGDVGRSLVDGKGIERTIALVINLMSAALPKSRT